MRKWKRFYLRVQRDIHTLAELLFTGISLGTRGGPPDKRKGRRGKSGAGAVAVVE